MYYDFIQQHKRKALLIGVGLFLLLVVWGIAGFMERNGKTAVTISTVPSDASVIIGDRKLGDGTHWISDNKYTVKAEKDGFESISKEVTISKDKEHNVIALSLTPKSDEAKKWAKDHQTEYSKNEQYGAMEASNNGKYFAKLNPITTKLPYKDPYFKISYKTNKDQSITLVVDTLSPRYRFYAVEKIREFGYDPTDFVIEFEDFKNPLEKR